MSPEERAQHTPTRDDPQVWPGEVVPDKLTIRDWVRLAVIAIIHSAMIYSLVWAAAALGGWQSRLALGLITGWTTILLVVIILSRPTRRPPSGTGIELPDRGRHRPDASPDFRQSR